MVLAFDGKLKELETFAKFEDALRKDKKKKEELENMISQIQHNIATAHKAQKTSNIIDGIDVVKDVEKEISSYIWWSTINIFIFHFIDSKNYPKCSETIFKMKLKKNEL